MRKTGFNVKNAFLILVTIILVIGTIKFVNFQEQDTISINAIALDNYGYLESEEFELKAKEIGDDLYEVELPESINEKKVAQAIQVVLDGNVVKIKDDKIILTKNQIENEKINLEVSYDVALLEKTNNDTYKKNLLKNTTQEERNNIKIAEGTELLYNKILKHEDNNTEKSVELAGFLPKDAELQVEEVSRDKITEIFGNKKIDVAYDIKILVKDENGETVKVNPADFGETCEVIIQNPKIQKDAKVYHVKEDNTYETVDVKQNTEENVSFDAHTFSIYAVGTEVDSEGIMSQEGLININPKERETAETTITVTAESMSGQGKINKYAWSKKQDSATDWEELDVPGYSMEFTKEGTGTFYLHVLTDAGNSGVGGPYNLDNTKPGKPKISGDREWTNTTPKTFNVTGGSDEHSGFDRYHWKYTDNSVSGDLSGSIMQFNDEQDKEIIVYAIDKAGNWSDPSDPMPVRIDKTNPEAGTMKFTLGSAEGAEYTSGDWTNQTVYLKLTNGSDEGGSRHKTTTYTINGEASTATTITEDGIYEIVVTTTDNAGNTAERTYTVKIDKTKPAAGTMEFTLGSAEGAEYTPGDWTNQAVYLKLTNGIDLGGSELQSTIYTINGQVSTATSITEDGIYEIVVTTIDNAGNTSETTYTVKIDKTNPEAGTMKFTLGSAEGAEYTSGDWTNQTVYLKLTNGSDEGGSGHKTTTYTINGQASTSTTITEEGTYEIVVTTTDNVGNTSEVAYTVKIDKTNPTAGTMKFTLGSAEGTEYTPGNWTNQTVYLELTNGEDLGGSGLGATTYTINGEASTATTITEDGIYEIEVTTVDNAGNASKTAYTVKIDKTNPTAGTMKFTLGSAEGTEYTPGNWTNQTVYLELTNGKDAGSGHKTTTYTINGEASIATSITEDGIHEIVVTTTDNVGNTSEVTYTVKIDKTKPEWGTEDIKVDKENKEITAILIGQDEIALNETTFDKSKLTVEIGETTIDANNIAIEEVLSTDGKTKTITLKIKYTKGGSASIILDAAALVDLSGNGSTKKTYSFVIDVSDVITSSVLTVTEDKLLIRDINPKTNAQELIDSLVAEMDYDIVNTKGEVVTGNTVIGTGYKIKMENNKEYTLIVRGDINGDGQIGIGDLARISRIFVSSSANPSELETLAIDISKNGKIELNDITVISRLRLAE